MNKKIESYFKKMPQKNNEVVINRDNIRDIFGEGIEEIDLSRYVIHKITSNCFSNFYKLKFINLQNRNLKIIEPFSFINCPKLEKIVITKSVILKLYENTFFNLPKLSLLFLDNNKILRSIKNGFITKCENLKSIIIYDCGILKLDSGIFSNYNYLKRISICHCNISRLEKDTFFNLPSLEYLDLDSNKNLSSIESGFINDCNKLSTISIKRNKISELKKNTFYKLKELRTLNLDDSIELQSILPKFINKCDNLYEIRLDRCRMLLGLYSNTFLNYNNLKVIYIRDSGILKLYKDTFSNLPSLEYLDLENNKNLRIIESGFINNCDELKTLNMSNNKSLSNINKNIIYNCGNLEHINLSNCNIQILHIDNFVDLNRLNLNIENNSLLMYYLSSDRINIKDNNNLLYNENNDIFDIIRDIGKGNIIYPNMSNIYSLYLDDEPTMKNTFHKKNELNNFLNISHYRYCIKIFRLDKNKNNNFESFMNKLTKINNSIIKENIFIILFIVILFLCNINIYYDKNSLEDNILYLINIVCDTLSMKYVENSLNLSENIPNEVGEYVDTNKYILQHKKIIIKIIGYLIDIYKGSSNFESTVTKFDSIMEYLYINNMKNKRKLKKINIRRTIIDKKMELSYIIKEINESLELPKLKESEIGLLLYYLQKLINLKKMKRINNPKEIQELSEHRNIQKKKLMRELVKTNGEESINNTIINYYDKVSDMYIMKLLSNNIKHKINK